MKPEPHPTPAQHGAHTPNQNEGSGSTPGPWSCHITRFPDGRNGYTVMGNDARGNRNVPVAEIPEWFFANLGTKAQHEANAKLIASAPQLQSDNAQLQQEAKRLREINGELATALQELSNRVDSWHPTNEKSILTLKARAALSRHEARSLTETKARAAIHQAQS